MRSHRVSVALLLTGLCACGDAAPYAELGRAQLPIIYGQPDTTHAAVVAVLGNMSACSGTIIHVNAAQSIGHVLTAAHCGVPEQIVRGNDYAHSSSIAYPVIDYQDHPSYNNQIFDFKMVRFTGASSATPVIPAMSSSADNLAVGTQVLHVGYGKSGAPPGSDNSVRHKLGGAVSDLDSLSVTYDSTNGGPCFGDSGGPQLSVGTERVVSVNSGVSNNSCTGVAVSGRVSAVYDAFIMPYINNAPFGPLTCDQCWQASTTGDGGCATAVSTCFGDAQCDGLVNCLQECSTFACQVECTEQYTAGIDKYNAINDCVCTSACQSECGEENTCKFGKLTPPSSSAGGSGAGVTTGAGATTGAGVGGGAAAQAAVSAGTGTGSDGWIAGTNGDQDYEGDLLMTSCTVTPLSSRSGDWWGAMALLGLVARRWRRAS